MSFSSLLTNWKTTVAAVALILLAVAHMFGINIPGAPVTDLGTAIITAIGLLTAGDASASAPATTSTGTASGTAATTTTGK